MMTDTAERHRGRASCNWLRWHLPICRRGAYLFSFGPCNAIARLMAQGSTSYVKLLRVVYTAVLALFVFLAQGLQTHAHIYDHAPHQTDHVHQSSVHFDHFEEPGEAHSDESAPIKVAQENLPKSGSFASLLGVFFAASYVYPPSLSLFQRRAPSLFHTACVFALGLAPPPRAPPL